MLERRSLVHAAVLCVLLLPAAAVNKTLLRPQKCKLSSESPQDVRDVTINFDTI